MMRDIALSINTLLLRNLTWESDFMLQDWNQLMQISCYFLFLYNLGRVPITVIVTSTGYIVLHGLGTQVVKYPCVHALQLYTHTHARSQVCTHVHVHTHSHTYTYMSYSSGVLEMHG